MKILYIPLDERPCNYSFPVSIALMENEVEIIVPPMKIMGSKKVPAQFNAIWDFIESNIEVCDAAVLSLDLFLYGGIVPSRLHSMDTLQLKERMDKLRLIKNKYPNINLYAFNLIMRVPSYNSSEEEPLYYGQYGEAIYRYSYINDKISKNAANEEELLEFEDLKAKIPSNCINDYINRRKVNEEMTNLAVELSKDKVLDFLIIPMDDNSEFGFSAQARRKINKKIDKLELWDKVYVYPGADEAGCTLIARAINTAENKKPKVMLRYDSFAGSNVVPMLEDRPVCESIKFQISAAGGIIVNSETMADLILFVNTPVEIASEDKSHNILRNLGEMAEALEFYVNKGIPCAIADVAYLNGGDSQLVKMLIKRKLYYKLYGYAGWNTCGNSLGTVISHAMVAIINENFNKLAHKRFLLQRYLDDWAYQSIIRGEITKKYLPGFGLHPSSLKGHRKTVNNMIKNELKIIYGKFLKEFKNYKLDIKKVYTPWDRMFEIDIEIGLNDEKSNLNKGFSC